MPVKDTAVGKSRLAALGDARSAVAAAMALDTIEAVSSASRVREIVVVTSDTGVSSALGAVPRVTVVPDPGAGLRTALLAGVAQTSSAYVAAVTADLPGLRPADLDAALVDAEQHRLAVVADADGTGTTLLAATDRSAFDPRFGAGSLTAHLALGAAELAAAPTLRRDVDLPVHLEALGASLGPRTAPLVAHLAIR